MNDIIDIISPMIKDFLPFAKKQMGFTDPPRLFLKGDTNNASNPLGKTAFYDPGQKSITVYTTGRHPKDIMRSLSHELVHHTQNCGGQFENVAEMGEGYAQNDDHLREMERQAYELGNMCFRDWEDGVKSTIYLEHLQKGVNSSMSTKDWKNKEISSLLSEAWGFKFKSLQEFEEFDGTGEIQEEGEESTEEVVEETESDDAEVQEEGGNGRKDPVRHKDADRLRDDRQRPMEESDDSDIEEGCGDKDDGDELEEDSFPGKRDMEQHKSDLSEARLREIIRMALKEKTNNG